MRPSNSERRAIASAANAGAARSWLGVPMDRTIFQAAHQRKADGAFRRAARSRRTRARARHAFGARRSTRGGSNQNTATEI